MKPILEIQSVSKKFNIHHEGFSYLSLRDRLTELAKFKSSKKSDEDFWALKDVSFDVMPGESIGIIGKNGAGKSTLLKILSKITPPTHGKIICRGRIASLLEVGTGFHPELTGRENVYLNGSILGMKKKEIDARFDEIVDFAGTERFLDTPLKHYSSGMQLRLAFAVAAFLEPEILVIDEVLAVGDAEFQKKCLGKMEDVSKSGRTILFVSHNLDALQTLCKKSIYLKDGALDFTGSTNDVINKYIGQIRSTNSVYYPEKIGIGDEVASLIEAEIYCDQIESGTVFNFDDRIIIQFTYLIRTDGYAPTPNVHIVDSSGHHVFVGIAPKSSIKTKKGKYTVRIQLPNYLNSGIYNVWVALTTLAPFIIHFEVKDIFSFELIEDIEKRSNDFRQNIPGVIRPDLIWEYT